MKKGQTSVRNGIEDILFPMEICNITQGDNVGTHSGTYAVDLAGKDTGRDFAYFPFSAKSVALDTARNGNAVIWESLNKVRFADGTVDYCCMMIIHDNDPTGFAVGSVYKQGQQMAQEGTAGFATGNHLHVEVKKGKFERGVYGMYDKNKFGVYHLRSNIPIEKACFMDGTTIKSGTANWKYLKDVPATTGNQNSKVDNILRPGDKFIFPKIYKLEKVDKNFNVLNSELKAYLSPSLIIETDSKGNPTSDQRVDDDITGSYFKIPGTFVVESSGMNGYKNGWVIPKGWGFKIDASTLQEVA